MARRTEVSELRADLVNTLRAAEVWLKDLQAGPILTSAEKEDVQRSCTTMEHLRTRGASTLLNVAFFGAFSSGKSFLLSGLQKKLYLVKVEGTDGVLAEKFIGLITSSPVPTNACPVSVIPVIPEPSLDTTSNGFMRVQFIDSGEWEDVGNSPAPATVAAYITDEADQSNRLRKHIGRKVAEVQILVSDTQVPAKCYDLPGYGSPNAIHDLIVKAAVLDADCLIFVTPASHSLREEDLALIRFLYDNFLHTGKKIVWVVTAIDLALQLDVKNMPAWRATVEKNNEYLRQHFRTPDGPDLAFIGKGFIPVSPAAEARARWAAEQGQPAEARSLEAISKMQSLRDALVELVGEEAGRRHIARVAKDARDLVGPVSRSLNSTLQTERTPVDELRQLLESQEERVRLVDAAIPDVTQRLTADLERRVDAASRPLAGMAARLHDALDQKIRTADVRKPDVANQIHVAKTQTVQGWLMSPAGAGTLWTTAFAQFKKVAIRLVEEAIGEQQSASRLDDYTFDPAQLEFPPPERRRPSTLDVMRNAAVVVGFAAPVAVGATWLTGLVAASVILPPAGVVAGAAALVYAGTKFVHNARTALDLARQEWISALDGEAAKIREQFVASAKLQGIAVIDTIVADLEMHKNEVISAAERTRSSIAKPDIRSRERLIEGLEPFATEGRRLTSRLTRLMDY